MNSFYDCELCGMPFPYVCDKCKEHLRSQEPQESVVIEEPKKYIGSGEDLDLALCK